MPQAPKESGHSISSERTSTTSCRRLQRRTAVRWRSRCCSVGRRKRRSGPWTLGSELIANVVRVDYSTHVAAPANRQLRPHVLALLASSRRRLGGPIVRRLLRESLNAGHRHGSPNAWAAMQSSCPADYILQGQFGQEAVRRGVASLGLRERRGLGFQAETEPLRLHQVVITSKPYASTPSKSTTAADLVTGHRAAFPHRGLRGFRGWRQLFGAGVMP